MSQSSSSMKTDDSPPKGAKTNLHTAFCKRKNSLAPGTLFPVNDNPAVFVQSCTTIAKQATALSLLEAIFHGPVVFTFLTCLVMASGGGEPQLHAATLKMLGTPATAEFARLWPTSHSTPQRILGKTIPTTSIRIAKRGIFFAMASTTIH